MWYNFVKGKRKEMFVLLRIKKYIVSVLLAIAFAFSLFSFPFAAVPFAAVQKTLTVSFIKNLARRLPPL